MKTGRTLTELAAEIERQAVTKKDYLADTRKMTLSLEPVEAYGKDTAPHLILEGQDQKYGITEIAHRQLGTTLGIPAKYYDKMLAEYPELLLQNVNGWFSHEPSERMVRTLDGNMRAFLSNRYRRIDHMEVAQAVLPIIGEMDEARVESCEITESRMYIKVVNPRLETEVVPGDVVQAGIIISNSEVGQGSVSIQPLVFRLVCTNGMVVNDAATRKNHVGRAGAAGENFELYSDETLRQDDKAFLMKVQDTVRAAVDEARFAKVVGLMKQAREAKFISKDVPAIVELTAKEYSLTDGERAGVLTSLIRRGDMTLYGLANAITEHSQQVESYDRATALESLGYDVLNMGRPTWSRINGVAA